MTNLDTKLQKRVTEVTKDIPFFAYKQLTKEELSSFSKHKNSTLFNLRDKVIIDRLYLQRLLTLWPELKIALYIRDFYNGFDKINAFVCVSLDEIIRVLKEIKGKTTNKSTIIHFIAEMESAKENGKEWLLINGQHRDIIWEKVWNNDIKLPIDFPNVGDKVIGESYWNEIDINTRCLLLTKTHPITFVNQFTSMSDLTHIVNLHNEGSEWNAHEKRSIEASYIMKKFRELDDDKTLKLLFKKLYASGNYEIGKKGISFLATQLYMIWKNSADDWNILYPVGASDLDDLVKVESDDWNQKSVDKFVKFFYKVCDELWINYFKSIKTTHTKVIRHKITTLRHYFIFRMIMEGRTNLNKRKYKVEKTDKFVGSFVLSESERLLPYNQLTKEGQKEYDKLTDNELTQQKIRELNSNYKLLDSYSHLINSSASRDNLEKIILKIWKDFSKQVNSGRLLGVVNKKGEKVSSSMKTTISRQKITDLDSFDTELILELQDKSKFDIGHTGTPRAKGGEASIGNLDLQDISENRRQQDKH